MKNTLITLSGFATFAACVAIAGSLTAPINQDRKELNLTVSDQIYDLPPEMIPRLWGGRFRGQSQHWFRLRFRGDDADVDISGHGHPAEFSRWAWMTPEEVVRLIVPFKRSVYDAVFQELLR